MPPPWMWPHDEELEIWFEEVESKRNERFGGGDSNDDTTAEMMDNEYARDRGR